MMQLNGTAKPIPSELRLRITVYGYIHSKIRTTKLSWAKTESEYSKKRNYLLVTTKMSTLRCQVYLWQLGAGSLGDNILSQLLLYIYIKNKLKSLIIQVCLGLQLYIIKTGRT
jgi:hypothetical protein